MIVKNNCIKVLLIIAGSLSVFLGFLGIFLPLLPTTPFLLLALACYSRSSEKLKLKLLNNKILGKYIKNYSTGNGLPLHAKIITLVMLWLSIGYSIFFAVSSLFIRAILLVIAVSVTIHLIIIKTTSIKDSTDFYPS